MLYNYKYFAYKAYRLQPVLWFLKQSLLLQYVFFSNSLIVVGYSCPIQRLSILKVTL